MTVTQTKINGEVLQKELDNFSCTEKYHKHYLLGFNYTNGVKRFAERVGAYWLLQEFNMGYYKLRQKDQEKFLSITAKSHKGECDISFTDRNGHQLYKKHIAHTYLPEDDWQFYLTDNILLLSSDTNTKGGLNYESNSISNN